MKSKKGWIVLFILLTVLLASGTYVYRVYFAVGPPELEIKKGTSVSAAIGTADEFLKAFDKAYPELTPYLSNEKPQSYEIPGLVRARNIHASGEKKGEVGYAVDMTPQGMAATEDYIIISAYSKSKAYHSVLWLLDKRSRKFVKTVVLEGTDHVGGLAYDASRQRLWITNLEKGWSNSMIASLDMKAIKSYDFSKKKAVISYDYRYDLAGVKRSSFMTFYQNKIFVGYFDRDNAGHLSYYDLDENGLPVETDRDIFEDSVAAKTIAIPSQIQGVTFYQDKIILSQSYGSEDSHLLVYKNPGLENLTNLAEEESLLSVAAPPYLEQTWADGGNLYALFESSASAYRSRLNILAVDRILKFDCSLLTEDD